MASPHKMSIRFFNDKEVRAVWDDEHYTISILRKASVVFVAARKCAEKFLTESRFARRSTDRTANKFENAAGVPIG